MNSQTWRDAGKQTLPVMFGYLPLGAAFGIVAIEVGIPWYAVAAMSIIIYAGAGQFLATTLLAAGAGLTEVAVATMMLNSHERELCVALGRRIARLGLALHAMREAE
ncbi:AzlC family ABC transporter permease [Halomonas piscis]|uniref:AzlC family ABC transporter permease n=1 Tax=Halomonas piscis TaxID=3031727 RepID=UPI002896A99C|nr:AzlC family ABC transporter permease [Halomonas piscis]